MSKLIIEMEMPQVCITKDGYYGNCPMDRVWCIQRNAPSGTKMRDAYAEMTDNIPSWCPIKSELPEEHGDLIDRDIMYKEIELWKSTATDTITLCFLYHIERLLMSVRPIIAAERKDDDR